MGTMNDKIFHIDLDLSETLERADYQTFTIWRHRETCKTLESIIELVEKKIIDLKEFIRGLSNGD